MTVPEFEQFLEAYEQDVFTFCRHLAMDYHTACDLYQETALAAFEMLARIDPAQSPKSFLFAIAAGKWKNMRRKAIRRQTIAPEMPLEDWANAPGQERNPTAKAAETTVMQAALHKAIGEMKDKFRIPLILHYFDDCPQETIAAVCAIPVGTVKSRLHKARSLLKNAMEKEGFGYE
ncbi:MAG: RNA polymerase sigma factor [Defluviitaleaceae bacterium]|nr:RNA polymerase sigma factor [Defluviitaleaceae bacterium]